MRIDGRCHCGRITYDADINPDKVIICHCTDCQTISGAPYRVNVPVLLSKFNLQGKPKTYLKTGDSGDEVATSFCGNCGTALYSSKGDKPLFVFLRVGSARQRAELSPKRQGFCRSAAPWATDIRDVPKT